jgi:Zn ribbon nucleic-acid-binding protein
VKSVQLFCSDGTVHCLALEVNGFKEFLARNICPKCGFKGAIKWNKFNKITQCHNCGCAYIDKNIKEKVQFT